MLIPHVQLPLGDDAIGYSRITDELGDPSEQPASAAQKLSLPKRYCDDSLSLVKLGTVLDLGMVNQSEKTEDLKGTNFLGYQTCFDCDDYWDVHNGWALSRLTA